MGQRKSSYLDVAKQAQETRKSAGTLRGEIGGFRTGQLQPFRQNLETIRTGARPDIESARSYYKGILEDPGRGKWSPETVRGMYGASTEAGAGARGAYLKDVGKQLAASGMGHTGAGLRMQKGYDEGFEARNRAAMRDINIQNELQAREAMKGAAAGAGSLQEIEDRWNLANLGQQQNILGMEQGTYNQQGETLGTELSSLGPQMQAYQGAYRPGFWGQLGSSFAQGLGGGLAGLVTGGIAGAGSALGQRMLGGAGGTGGMGAGMASEMGSVPYGQHPMDEYLNYNMYSGNPYGRYSWAGNMPVTRVANTPEQESWSRNWRAPWLGADRG